MHQVGQEDQGRQYRGQMRVLRPASHEGGGVRGSGLPTAPRAVCGADATRAALWITLPRHSDFTRKAPLIQGVSLSKQSEPPLPTGETQAADQGEANFQPTPAPLGLDKFQAMEQAGNDVTQVFKVGKGYRVSVYDHISGQWLYGSLVAQEADADRLRQAAFKPAMSACSNCRAD